MLEKEFAAGHQGPEEIFDHRAFFFGWSPGEELGDSFARIFSRLAAEAEHGIVFLDWRGQIMMYFEVDAPSGDIKKDVKRLLRASKIK